MLLNDHLFHYTSKKETIIYCPLISHQKATCRQGLIWTTFILVYGAPYLLLAYRFTPSHYNPVYLPTPNYFPKFENPICHLILELVFYDWKSNSLLNKPNNRVQFTTAYYILF